MIDTQRIRELFEGFDPPPCDDCGYIDGHAFGCIFDELDDFEATYTYDDDETDMGTRGM